MIFNSIQNKRNRKQIKEKRKDSPHLPLLAHLAHLHPKTSPAHRGAGSSSSSCQEDSTGAAHVHVDVPPPASMWRPPLDVILRLEAPRVTPSSPWPIHRLLPPSRAAPSAGQSNRRAPPWPPASSRRPVLSRSTADDVSVDPLHQIETKSSLGDARFKDLALATATPTRNQTPSAAAPAPSTPPSDPR